MKTLNIDLRFLPKDVMMVDEVDQLYSAELKRVNGGKAFERFLHKWSYWLDESSLKLKDSDWDAWVNHCLFKIRIENDPKEVRKLMHRKDFQIASALAIPEKILLVSIKAQQLKVPWGLCYHRMHEAKAIKY